MEGNACDGVRSAYLGAGGVGGKGNGQEATKEEAGISDQMRSSSSNYILFSSVLSLVLRLFAFLFLARLRS